MSELIERLGEIRTLDSVFLSTRHRATIDMTRDRIDELEAANEDLDMVAGLRQSLVDELEMALMDAQKTNGRLVVEKLDLERQLHRALGGEYRDRIADLESALERIDREGSGESDLAEHLADIARRALGDENE